MPNLYTIGFTKKSAETFFTLLAKNKINLLVDTRLHNRSQVAAFTKEKDLKYFLSEILRCKYVHDLTFAPTKNILSAFKSKGEISWETYNDGYERLIKSRKMVQHYKDHYLDQGNVVLLCSEATPEHCHRRLLAEAISKELGLNVVHL